jgi:hypothetical protein
MINGGTGPVLAFSGVLFDIAKQLDVNFLVLNAWVGIWVTGFLLISAFVDLNKLMKHATRFTDELFAMLIATIFIVDALGNPFSQVGIYWYFTEGHESHDEFEGDTDYSHMATALLSLILCIGTTWLAFFLRSFKFSPYFPNDAWRTVICDFAVVFSILVWAIFANTLFDNVEVERLNVPDSIVPTQVCCDASCMTSFPQDCPDIEPYGRRDWFIDLSDVNGKTWVPLFAAIPALLAFILVFLDDGITWHLLNHPSHKLTHGEVSVQELTNSYINTHTRPLTGTFCDFTGIQLRHHYHRHHDWCQLNTRPPMVGGCHGPFLEPLVFFGRKE